jgi:hypothetical protein
MKTYTLEQIKDIYNDYRNNYLTTTRTAEAYQTTPRTLQRMFNKINIHYNVIGTTIIMYKAVSEDTLQSLQSITLNKPIELLNAKEIVQSKYPNHIINRLRQ